jgi:hypothetical protein
MAIVATCFRESQLFKRVTVPLNSDYLINQAIGDGSCLLTTHFQLKPAAIVEIEDAMLMGEPITNFKIDLARPVVLFSN